VFAANETGGAYAEYLAVKPAAIARKPSNLSFQEAASVPEMRLDGFMVASSSTRSVVGPLDSAA
jgi:NADPH:quinone reductase-like Zn-dependent oxidoreductase